MFNFKWFYTLLFLMPVLLLVSPAMAQTGQELYNGSGCTSCHSPNPGSTIPGPSESYAVEWNRRIENKGIDGLYASAMMGISFMQPCTNYNVTLDGNTRTVTEDECILIIDYMLEAAGVSLSPPPPPPIRLELRLFLEGTLK